MPTISTISPITTAVGTTAPTGPAADIAKLSAVYPIALLPVRIETRFVTTGTPQLKIRIYPDEIAADIHEPRLTADELAAGTTYWTQGWDPAAEPAAWQQLAAQFQTTRAAWIARVTTPTNLGARPTGAPTFPTVAQRTASLASAQSRVLPDAWVAIAYRGGAEISRATSSPVVQPLQLAFRPDVAENDPSLVSFDELQLEPELAWAVDFDHAVATGMACTLPLTTTDVAQGFDRLIVVGVKASLAPTDAAAAVSDLLDAHHYTRGLALVRQGTPTNNTQTAGAAGYPPPTDPSYSFAIERGAPLAAAGSDGARLALAFGVPTSAFDHVDGADRTEDANAGAMSRALWPCTLGYFLEQIATPLVSDAQIADVRAHAAAFVRGRGPFAAFRVGRVPYGVLPVTAIASWKSATAGTVDTGLAARLAVWKTRWLALASGVSRVGNSSDPDADLLGVLGLDASAREIRLRETIGPAHVQNLLLLLGSTATADVAARTALASGLLGQLDLADMSPRFAGLTFAPTALRIGRPFVTAAALSETAPLAPNYIDELRGATIDALRAAGQTTSPEFGNPLLFHLLRQAILVELARISVGLAIAAGTATAADRVEVELVKISAGTTAVQTAWDRFAAPLAAKTGALALGAWLIQPSTDADREPVRDYYAALAALSPLPTAELDRLMTETLDTCAYRLDAWLTSMASRKLAAMRAVNPTGVYLGAFAWVDGVRPQSAAATTPGGFIHAPSATHAAAAAILRNAYLTRTGAERDQVAIDLSSRRVRVGLELIDGVRQGQPLGALLGYRFEAALHAVELDSYIEAFRARFPLGNDPSNPPSASTEKLPARNVVDGLALRTAVNGQTTAAAIPWANLPAVAAADQTAMAPCLAQLDNDVDATADLLLAESVFQVAQGNIDPASATLAALAGGATLPDPQIAEVPRSVTSYSQRVAIAIAPPGQLAAGWNPAAPRALAEPRLNAWLAARFGDPARVECRVSYGAPATTATVTFADLGLCPLDVIALSRTVPSAGGGELDARIVAHAQIALKATAPIAIDYSRATSPDIVTPLELLDVARLLDAAVLAARPLAPQDLTQDASGGDNGDATELASRATAASAALNAACAALGTAATAAAATDAASLSALRAALWTAAGFGIREAVPAAADADVLAQPPIALAEIERRLTAAASAADGTDQLVAVFGTGFTVLPTFAPANASDLATTLGYSTTLVGDVYATRRWFESVARVRSPLARVRLAALAVEAIGGGAIDLTAVQLPHVAGAQWIALPFDATKPEQVPVAGTLSLVLHADTDIAGAASLAGFVLDDWTEAIPAATQLTSFAVHHDAPGAEAAQCVLLAVPPTPAASWDLPTLIAVVQDAIDLAQIRAVDSDLLGAYAMAVPTTYIAANVADDTISLTLAAQVIAEATILPPSTGE